MRIVTVPFVTVIELTAPCCTKSNKYMIKPLLISITSFCRKCQPPQVALLAAALSDGFFIISLSFPIVNRF